MPRYVAFLRAINVGGHVVKMETLRALFEEMKFKRVETFIASGNVVFESSAADTDKLQSKIEAALRNALGYEVSTFLRSCEEVAAVARYQPFAPDEMEAAPTFCVGFAAEPLSAELKKRAAAISTADDQIHVHGGEVYWLGRNRQSEAAFSGAIFERATGIRITFRSMTTIRKLAAKYAPERAA